jgi:hypothetical protein
MTIDHSKSDWIYICWFVLLLGLATPAGINVELIAGTPVDVFLPAFGRGSPGRSVLAFEDAGAGDLSRADVAGLQIWLTKHSDVARNIASQCKEAMKADTAWKNSAEGRICIAEKDAGYSN